MSTKKEPIHVGDLVVHPDGHMVGQVVEAFRGPYLRVIWPDGQGGTIAKGRVALVEALRREGKPPYYTVCTVRRTVRVTHGTLNMVTGESTRGRTETVTQPCGTPLFAEEEHRQGICSSCREGWNQDGNAFACEAEARRATGSSEVYKV